MAAQGTDFFITFSFLQVKTVKVSNVSLGASERDLKEFFSFSGDIEYVEMKRYCAVHFHILSPTLSFIFLCCLNTISYACTVIMSDLKLHMLPSKILKEQTLLFFSR
jgi:RNA recognition motif-containing protein